MRDKPRDKPRDKRFLALLALAVAAGFATPWLVPANWLGGILEAGLLLLVVWALLAAVNARGGAASPVLGLLSWWVINTDRPLAEVTDRRAVQLFWLTLLYLVSFGVGAFAAVRA